MFYRVYNMWGMNYKIGYNLSGLSHHIVQTVADSSVEDNGFIVSTWLKNVGITGFLVQVG